MAVTPSRDNPTCTRMEIYGITHLHSGALIGSAVWALDVAKQLALLYGPMTNWERPIIEILLDANLRDKVRVATFEVEVSR